MKFHTVWPPRSVHPPISDDYEGIQVIGIPGKILRVTVRCLIVLAIGFAVALFEVWPK